MLKKAVTGEGIQLMKVTGSGEVFLADTAQDVHLLYLENDYITVNGPNLLAFDTGIDWDIKRVEGASGMMGGGLYNMSLHGTGWGAIISDGPSASNDDEPWRSVQVPPSFAMVRPGAKISRQSSPASGDPVGEPPGLRLYSTVLPTMQRSVIA